MTNAKDGENGTGTDREERIRYGFFGSLRPDDFRRLSVARPTCVLITNFEHICIGK
jgi:hypothetical protein